MRANGKDPAGPSDRALWWHSLSIDAADDEAARLLDLAGFADGSLDADDRERVAEWLSDDPAAATDVAAARAQAAASAAFAPAPAAVVARACALVDGGPKAATIVAFPGWRRDGPRLRGMAQWGSFAAALAVAAWLGFTLGTDTSRAFVAGGTRPAAASFLGDLLDAQTPLVGTLGEDSQT